VRLLCKLALFALLSLPAFGQTLGSVNGQCAKGGQALVTQGLPSTGTQNLSASEGTIALSLGTGAIGSFPGCTITVYLTGTTNVATIYSTVSSTPLANPFTGNVDGSFLFFALPIGYDILLSGGGMPSPVTLTDVVPTIPATNLAALTLETNSVLNGSQTLLNLVAGSGITITNVGGIDTFTAAGGSGCGTGTTGNFLEFLTSSTCGNAPMEDLGTAGTLSLIPSTGSFQVNLGTGGTSGAQLVVGNVTGSDPYTAYLGTRNFANLGNAGSGYCYMNSNTGTTAAYAECGGEGTADSSQLFVHGYNSLTSGLQNWSLGDTVGNAIYGIAQGGSGNPAGVTITAPSGQAFIVKVNGAVMFSVNSTGPSFTGPQGYTPQNYSTLPSCASFVGYTAVVQDSTTNTWGATISGSGGDTVLAFCDGVNWTVAGK
jgi:hypothetical protein